MKTRNLLHALTTVATLILFHRVDVLAQNVPLQQATATFSQSGYDIASAIDGITEYPPMAVGGWGVLDTPGSATNQVAVFETAADVGFPEGTILSFTLFQTHWNPGHTLGRFRLSVTASSRSEFADGLVNGGDVTADWVLLTPHFTRSSNSTSLTRLSDQSVRASGPSPNTDTYTIEALTSISNITGIRIEALEDASLPFDGPGRYPANGNFVLSEVQLRASAATNFYWTNALGGNWNDPSNWSPNRLPTALDHAFITAPGTYTVIQTLNATLLSLTLGGASGTQTLANSSVTLSPTTGTVNPNGVLALGGGTLGGTNTIHGVLNWVGGTLNTSARLVIAPDGALNISGVGTKSLAGALTNAGTVTWTGTGAMDLGSSGFIHNFATGLFDVQNNAPMSQSLAGPFFRNLGLFRKSSGTGTNLIFPYFNNSGAVEALTGTLYFNNGYNSGTFNAGTGATIQHSGTFAYDSGSALAGAGTNRWSGGTITISGDFNASNLELAGGALTGTNTISGVVNWTGGTLSSLARVTIATNGTLNISGAGTKSLVGALTNAGTVTWAGTGALDLGTSGSIHNLVSGLFDVQNNAPMSQSLAGPFFRNLGLFRKSSGSGTNLIFPYFNNSGAVEALTGTLFFNNGYNSGTFNAGAGATIQHSGTFAYDSGSALAGAGTNRWSGGTITISGDFNASNLELAGGALTGTNTISGVVNWTGGTLSSLARVTIATNGTLNISGTGTKSLVGVLTNAGTVTWAGTGALDLGTSGSIHNLVSGLFDVQNNASMSQSLAGPFFRNLGVFRKSSGTGTNLIFPNLSNSGIVEVVTGTLRFVTAFSQYDGATLLKGGDLIFVNGLPLAGGLLGGSGQIVGNVASSSQISPGLSAGRLSIQGAYTQRQPGSFNCEIGGTIAGTNHDQVVITGNATLTGTVHVVSINGFTPSPGDRFEIMKFASRSGSVTFKGLDIANRIALVPELSATNIVLVATSVPATPAPRLNMTRNGDALWVSWPQGYPGFQLHSATNLTTPIQWSPVSDTEPNRAILAPSGPATFFRLVNP